MRKSPAWLDSAVFYEIYPQSFYDSNGDGIGDIQGIIRKLDYIAELGCSAVWMNPCFLSPFNDAGYDVADYYTVAPRYGTNEDLKELFTAAHRKGMHVILDFVPGHTSYTHPWFQASMSPERNEYTDRYVWTDSVWAMPDGFQTLRGISQRDGSAVVNFFSTQPALNYGFYQPDPNEKWQQSMDAPGPLATRQELIRIMRFWLDLGCDGFRVDMAGSLVKNDPDAVGTIRLWNIIREELDRTHPEAVLISEWGDPSKSLAGGFDMDFLLHFGPSHYPDLFHSEKPYFSRNGSNQADEFVETYLGFLRNANGGLICIPTGNHDMERMAYYLDDAERRLVFAFLLSMPGAPFIYYGDEIGMRYQNGLPSKEGGYFRTGARTPMQWNKSENAGFSAADADQLYLPIDSDENRPDAESQMEDADSLWNEVSRLIRLRQQHPALQSRGAIEFLSAGTPLVYRRSCETEQILIAVNTSDSDAEIPYDGSMICHVGTEPHMNDGICRLAPCSAVWMRM